MGQSDAVVVGIAAVAPVPVDGDVVDYAAVDGAACVAAAAGVERPLIADAGAAAALLMP